MFVRVVLLLVAAAVVVVHSAAPPAIVSVLWDSGSSSYKFVNGTVDGRVAWGNFTDQIDQNGWSFLQIITNESYSDRSQAYAAGLAEGYLTTNLLYYYWMNTVEGYCQDDTDTAYCDRLWNFLNDNQQWMKQQTTAYAATDPYWHQVDLVLQQLQGLQDGYQESFPITDDSHDVLQDFGFLFFQIAGDLEDLEEALNKTSNLKHVQGVGSCSALIKLLPGNSDLYISHDSWNTYQSMTRVIKRYEFYFHSTDDVASPLMPGLNSAFSSYPGSLDSMDDFYVISSGLATIETTIGNNNPDLWQYVQPNSLFEYMRTILANRLATDGQTWSSTFVKYNSGTYNNQWMAIDYNKFQAGSTTLKDGLLWIVEQLPGTTKAEDRTDTLRQQGYWPSYNAPYFPEIFNLSGTQQLVEQYGDWYSYDKTPRALIFDRDVNTVVDLTTMTTLMRSNDYTHDPLSACNCTPPYSAENAIAARSDLNPANGTYEFSALGHRAHGAIDMKVSNVEMFWKLQMLVYGGPTYDSVPPFQWSTFDLEQSTPHLGQPDLWQFKPLVTAWN